MAVKGLECKALKKANTEVMSNAGTPARRGYAIEYFPITLIWASYIDSLRLPASTGSEPCSSGFTPINLSSNFGNKVQKLSNEDWGHEFSEKISPSRTPGKRKRAEVSKAPRRLISNGAKSRQPQNTRNSKSSRDQEFLESQSRRKPLSIAPQKSGDNVSSFPQLASQSQEQDEPSQNANLDEICKTDSITQGSFWPEAAFSNHSADDSIPRECFEATSLAIATQADGYQENMRLEADWQPSPEGLNNIFKQVSSHKEVQEGRSSNTFPDYSPGDLLDLGKYDATSLDDGDPFDTLINDFAWTGNASRLWDDDDNYPMTGDDVLGIMQLAEVEKVMTAAEGTSTAEEFDAGAALPSLSTEITCVIESNADDPCEVDDLFIDSLQADCNDSEPEENFTENGSFAISSPQPARRSSPCSQYLDSVAEVRSESLYDDEDLDRELLNLGASAFSNLESPPLSTPPSSPISVSLPKPAPLEKPTPRPNIPHIISFNAEGNPLPFIRQPFAKPVRDRPVIHALRSEPVLRTCFRIGEALNAACAASSSNIDSVIELYARVTSSTREREPSSSKQHFQFADLFTPDKPPFLNGVYTLWRGVELWDHGSRVFLGEAGKGRMARVVGKMRIEKKGDWMVVILCIWQVDWDEVGLAKGIVCS